MHKRNSGYVEGYVDGGERDIKPFNPNQQPIQEIIIVPPASGNGGILFVQYVQTVNTTSIDGSVITPETFSFLPFSQSDIWITINGLSIYPANGISDVATSAFYVTDNTGTIFRTKGTYQINDVLRWNGSVANYGLDSSDEVKIIYEI